MSKANLAYVTVRAKDRNMPAEKLIRKFIRKVKKAGIVEEVRERTYYTKPSDLKRLKRKRSKALRAKALRVKRNKINKNND
tara:strand:- start:705 stop:947 length:243 start_codon:yes stop_codon:yes gene_type:complete